MKQFLSGFQYLLFWIMLGLILAVSLLIFRGDLQPGLVEQPAQTVTPATAADIAPREKSFADAVAIASPAVVTIRAITTVQTQVPEGVKLLERFLGKNSPHAPKTRKQFTSGSGVIMDTDGYILTNHHVIKDADKLAVQLTDGRSAYAQLVGTDPDTDLAVLKITLPSLPVAKVADISRLRIGDIALAIGYPFEIGQTVTQGIISATGRKRIGSSTYENFIQTDAAINPGNSGGALVNTRGELVGINSLIYSRTGNFQGIGFAIPVDMATQVLQQIKLNGFVQRGWLGVEGQEITSALLKKIDLQGISGVLITSVEKEGPADLAHIQRGDIITHINGKPIYSISDIMQTVADGSPGDVLRVEGIRQRESFMAEVTLGQRPLVSTQSE